MKDAIIYLDKIETWPNEVKVFLDAHYHVLLQWQQNTSYAEMQAKAKAYDECIYGLNEVLSKYFLHGYHCTRLTANEINEIRHNGMDLPNEKMLNKRITFLIEEGLISDAVGKRLKEENQSSDDNRANMIWFCFFKPYIATQSGIERFFRSWGGEALYNSHENIPETGRQLMSIGMPCIVEAKVAIKHIYVTSFSIILAKEYMVKKGIIENERTHFEGYSLQPIPSAYILNIATFPDQQFIELTKCHLWDPPLN